MKMELKFICLIQKGHSQLRMSWTVYYKSIENRIPNGFSIGRKE